MNIKCPQCGFGRDVPADNVPAGSVIARCPKCGCRFRFSARDGAGAILPPKNWNGEAPPEDEDIRETARQAYEAESRRFKNGCEAGRLRAAREAEKEAARNPWAEAPAPDGWAGAFYQTILRVMFQASHFFRNLAPGAPAGRPLAFFLIICVFQTLVERVWGQIIHSFLAGAAREDPDLEKLLSLLTPDANIALLTALRCGSLLLQLYVFSLLMFLAYKLVAREKAVFFLVFQVVAYSAAPWVLCVIPGVGSLAGTIWGVVCMAIGMKAALDLSWQQTLVGFLPLVALMAPILPQLFGFLGQ